jgi:hypothetical protein
VSDEAGHRAIVEAAYSRLREKLEAKDVSVDGLKKAALEALATARTQVELDPDWVAGELDRLRGGTSAPVGEPPGAAGDGQVVK